MSEPNELGPTEDPIAASLKRQFSPPSLDALEARIAAEAARLDEGSDPAPATASNGPHAANETRGRGLVALAFFAAAAAVLIIARPWALEPTVRRPQTSPIAKTDEPQEVIPPTVSERAGSQLDGFLERGDALTSADACGPREPVEVCNVDAGGYPHLPGGLPVTLLGECGGTTGTSCDEFDLPANRALLVQLSTGERALVCIEHPWTDPKPRLPPGSRYTIVRHELGEYILYEVTPLGEAEAAPLMRL